MWDQKKSALMAMAHGRVMFGVGPAASNAWADERCDVLMVGRTRAIERARQDYTG